MNFKTLVVSLLAFVVLASAMGACSSAPQLPAGLSKSSSSVSVSASSSAVSSATMSSAASSSSSSTINTSFGTASTGVVSTSSQSSSTSSSSSTISSGGTPNAATILPAAIAKTRAATIFKATEETTMDSPFGAIKDKTTLLALKGEFNGKDAHVRISGTIVSLLNDTPVDSVEFTQVGGKGYVHGPASMLGAPNNQWYILPANSPMATSPNPFDTFDQIINLKPEYADFKYSQTVMNGVTCNIFLADKTMASKLWSGAIFSATGVNPVIDDGSVEMIACSDGYLHGLTINLSGHDPKDTTKKGTARFFFAASEFDTKITIATPTNAIPALDVPGFFGSSSSASSSSRASSASTSSGTPSANVNGSWKGSTANDDSISFTVDKNQVTFMSLNLTIRNGACSGSTSIARSIDNTPIANDTFTLKLESSSGGMYTMVGNFKSGFMTGTIQGSGKLPCDATNFSATWTAQNTTIVTSSSSASSPRPTATVIPTPTKTASSSSASSSNVNMNDPVAVATAFFAAINAKNADAAVALADNFVIFNFGKTSGLGKDALKANLEAQILRGITYTATEYDPFNGILDFKARASDGTVYNKSSIIFGTNNKIQILSLQ